MLSPSLNLPPLRGPRSRGKQEQERPIEFHNGGNKMAWTTPVIVEVCVGMEVTAYSSAEI